MDILEHELIKIFWDTLINLGLMNYAIIVISSFLILPKHTLFYRYSYNVLIILDCAANAILLLGDYRETISSRIGKAYLSGVKWIIPIMYLINILFYPVERNLNHCVNAIQLEYGDLTLWEW